MAPLMTRWIAPAVVALGLGAAVLMPAPARASDDLVRVLVDVADIIYHSGRPYYRHGNYGRYDRVVVVRDRYGHRNYYRYVPRSYHGRRHRGGPPYGVAHGYYGTAPGKYKHKNKYKNKYRRAHDRRGRVSYYDPRRDSRRWDHRDDRRWDRRDERRRDRRGGNRRHWGR